MEPLRAESTGYLLARARLEASRGNTPAAEAALRQALALDPACDEAASMLLHLAAPPATMLPGDDELHPRGLRGLIERMGMNWGILGWCLFAGWFIGPYFAGSLAGMIVVWLASLLLWTVWMVVDVLDQQPELWKIGVGVLLYTLAFAPRYGPFLRVALWVIYWLRARE